MSLAFSRRSFLKYSAVAAVAVAGASLFSGCDQIHLINLISQFPTAMVPVPSLFCRSMLFWAPTMTMPRSTRTLI